MVVFHPNEKYDKELRPIKCPYCPNSFLGNNAFETREIVARHVRRKHGREY